MYDFSRDKLIDILEAALAQGGDYAELFFEESSTRLLSYLDHKVDKMSAGKYHGVGLRILYDKKTIYLYSNKTNYENLFDLARKGAEVIGQKPVKKEIILPQLFEADNHPVEIIPASVDLEEKLALLRLMDEQAGKVSDKIVQVINNYSEKERNILIYSSDGIYSADSQTYCRLITQAVANDGKENQTIYNTHGALKGFEFLKDFDPAQLAINAAEIALTMLTAGYPPSGIMPVVIENGFGGVIFHEACGHALEATSVADDASVFCGKMGQVIASEIVSAVDDGTIPHEWGSINIDDEGLPAQRTQLIKNGVLTSYLVDKLGSLKMGDALTGSSRRESYQYPPTSRMRNTFITQGTSEFEELLNGIKLGLYAKKMGGGSVDPATTEYNFAVAEGYLIENGKITKPLRGATLIGRGNETLMNIDRVGRNVKLADGTCGSISGSVPTTVGQPAIRVQGLTVGGR